jgi:hypothetical protein
MGLDPLRRLAGCVLLRQLLEGAVDAIIDLELQYPDIQITTEIKRTIGGGGLMSSGLFGACRWRRSTRSPSWVQEQEWLTLRLTLRLDD